jgi:hypothetical protein
MNKIVIVALFLVFLASCKEIGKDKSSENEDSANKNSKFELTEQIREVYHRFPSPEEMFSLIDIDSISFDPNLINKPSKSTQYLDSRSQSLNLGVYAADLAYLSLFKKHNESAKYFEVLYELSDELRISSAFDRSLLFRIQENITNPDSLKVISELAFVSLSDYLESNDNEKVFALLSIGGFVEALYLSFNLCEEYNKENPITQQIADQKLVLENIVSYALLYSNDSAVESGIKELQGIRSVYNELLKETRATTVTRDETGKLKIMGGDKLTMSEAQFLKLKEETFKARIKITQN